MIADIVRKTETLTAEDNMGTAIAKMGNSMPGLPIVNKKYEAMIYLKDIVIRDFDTGTKVGSMSKRPRKVNVNEKDEVVMKSFMEYPVLPVFNGDEFIGVVTIDDFIRTLKLKGTACEYASDTALVSTKDDIGTARNLLSCDEVILVEENGKIIGGVDVFSLAKHIAPKKHKAYTPEKIIEKDIGLDSIMNNAIEVGVNEPIHKALELLKTNPFLVCEDNIITPRTILENVLSEREVDSSSKILELVGFDLVQEDDSKVTGFDGSIIIKELENFAARTEKLIKPREIKFHLHLSKKLGKDLYHVEAKIMAGGNPITADHEDRILLDCVQTVIDKLDVQIERLKETDETRVRKAGKMGRHPGRDEL